MILDLAASQGTASAGESDTARFIAERAKEAKQAFYETYTLGHALYDALSELIAIKGQCNAPDWDGYNAVPISDKAIWAAYRFLEALPQGLPAPSIGAEPDGHITLEWHRSPWRTLSVSVSPDDILYYSAILGPNNQYGTEVFFGETPKSILDLIHRV